MPLRDTGLPFGISTAPDIGTEGASDTGSGTRTGTHTSTSTDIHTDIEGKHRSGYRYRCEAISFLLAE